MISFAAPRRGARWWILMLALGMTLIPGSCRSPSGPDLAREARSQGPFAPPKVYGRARWFNKPTTTPVLPSLDLQVDETDAGVVEEVRVNWHVLISGRPGYPGPPQAVRVRTIQGGEGIWYADPILADFAYVTGGPQIWYCQVRVTMVTKDKKHPYEELLPLDDTWHAIDDPVN
ncbi:MAG: hypothetical protein ACKVXR_05530 [Planctomycetota bacterium]